MSGDVDLAARLEMLLVLQWLDDGRPPEGDVMVSVSTAAAEMGREGPSGLLAVMGALGALEEAGRVRVEWPGRPGDAGEARVLLSRDITRDADRLFGTGA
jgi:hypothetical protein